MISEGVMRITTLALIAVILLVGVQLYV